MKLTLNPATIVLVAEILRAERGAEACDVDDAGRMIVEAIKRLRDTGDEVETEMRFHEGELD
ncbi:hypothetical protein [Acidimangrovimonas sediminis]|uniref:hypothetical protein n=1 Tax=Acidimangrovimonas sediminis TaxID=2056283 RepID=UPI000C80F8C4|nr:hypothetical protein [Acidimangrovimonas sediminis]